MMERIAEASPRFRARMAGVFQLFEALTAGFGEVIVLGRLVVAGNAAATAISWGTSDYFGWGSHPPSSGLRYISFGRF
jgi:hypothetical protein